MKISTRTEYGIRVLVTLARAEGDGPVSLAGVAKAEKLPHAYLEQLVARPAPRRPGHRHARPGRRLRARPPGGRDRLVADAVRALEGPLLEMPCAGADNLEACDRPQPCSVHEVFQRVYEALDASLTATTIADVAATAGGPPFPPQVRRAGTRRGRARRAGGERGSQIAPARSRTDIAADDHRRTKHEGSDQPRMTDELVIRDLEVSIGRRRSSRASPDRRPGEVHALMGPNGSGKTSLAYTLMGHPDYHVDAGSITWAGEDLLPVRRRSACRRTSGRGWGSSSPSSTRAPSPA